MMGKLCMERGESLLFTYLMLLRMSSSPIITRRLPGACCGIVSATDDERSKVSLFKQHVPNVRTSGLTDPNCDLQVVKE